MRQSYRRIIRGIFREVIVNKYKSQSFWILGAFIPTFLLARLTVRLLPDIFLSVNGNHVHHFTYGIILLAIAGYIAVTKPTLNTPWLAILFGIGLALAVDETGMWLHLTNVYYNDTSEDAVIVVGAILINLVYFGEFWMRLLKLLFSQFRHLRK